MFLKNITAITFDPVKEKHIMEKFMEENDMTEWVEHRATVGITLQPEPQWIPCSERLPEDGENVLVTYKTTDKIHPCQYHDDGSRNPWYSYIDQCRAHMNVVLAWMPLPEPWRGEDDEQQDCL